MKRVEYWIAKKFDDGTRDDNFDGPFTLRTARAKFDASYRIPGGARKQDFAIVKVMSEDVPLHKVRTND